MNILDWNKLGKKFRNRCRFCFGWRITYFSDFICTWCSCAVMILLCGDERHVLPARTRVAMWHIWMPEMAKSDILWHQLATGIFVWHPNENLAKPCLLS